MTLHWTPFLALVMAFAITIEALSAPAYRPAPPLTVQVDPYKTFKFRVKLDGRVVAGFSKVIGLQPPSRSGPSPLTAITLLQGVTHDTAFEHWASALSKLPANARRQADRKDVDIQVMNELGHVAKTYFVSHARVSKYQGAPNLDANANEVAIELIELEHEGLTLK